MNVYRLVSMAALAVICCGLCHCTSASSSGGPHLVFGFLPQGMSIQSRSTSPALTETQAQEKKMSQLESSWRVQPESEIIDLSTSTSLRVIHVPARAEVLQRDYPVFARAFAGMKDFINSKPAAYPEVAQPDFLFANAGMYIRAKFRLLDLPWGKAVMMLVQYTQGPGPPPPNSDDLRIWIRGMSDAALRGEGGFCLSSDLTVKHPLLKSRDAACADIEGQDETQAMAKAEKELESYTDDSFTPSLRDIERMLRELHVEQDRS